MKIMKTLSIAAVTGFLALPAMAANVTPDIIFGSGNHNGGFTVATIGDLELGLRAKRRYTTPNDAIGVGIIQDAAGNYLFDSTGATVPAGRSYWSYDWSINSDIADGSDSLGTYKYQISVDYDPSAAENMQIYDPLGAVSTGYYLGTNATANGAATFDSGGDEDFSAFNVAQNSVNMGFLPGAPIGAGQFRVSLTAFDSAGVVGSTSINVYADTPVSAVPLPAGGFLLLTALGGLALRRKRKA